MCRSCISHSHSLTHSLTRSLTLANANSGYVRCTVCDGYRNLIHFLRLDIAWRNKRQRAVIDAEDDQLEYALLLALLLMPLLLPHSLTD